MGADALFNHSDWRICFDFVRRGVNSCSNFWFFDQQLGFVRQARHRAGFVLSGSFFQAAPELARSSRT